MIFQQDKYYFSKRFIFHLLIIPLITIADIERNDDDSSFRATFSVVNNGRLFDPIFVTVEKMELSYCMFECIKYLQCRSINFNEETQSCELNGGDYDEMEVDGDSLGGWKIYSTPGKVHGGYTAWTPFSDCSRTCEGGIKTRYRTCSDPRPEFGGDDCNGERSETRSCNTDLCPIDGGFTSWTNFTSCSKTCDQGSHSRERFCTNPKPAFSGSDCVGKRTETQTCNLGECPKVVYRFQKKKMDWAESKEKCLEWKGHLVTIYSEQHNDFLKRELKKREMRSIWTGLNDVVDEGTFVWDGITALVVNYTNWERDGYKEPNGAPTGKEDCVEFIYGEKHAYNFNGTWNDEKCSEKLMSVCEKNHEPDNIPDSDADETVAAIG